MTQKEMTEIFSLLLLAYPNAEIFKGGVQKLAPTINLWCECLPDVDFWIAQQAVIKLCRECKFPPTIAEFKEKADAVKSKVEEEIETAWSMFRLSMDANDLTPKEAFDREPHDSPVRMVIEAMGGPEQLLIQDEHVYSNGDRVPYERYDYDGFCATYERLLRQRTSLPGSRRPPIGNGNIKQIGGGKR